MNIKGLAVQNHRRHPIYSGVLINPKLKTITTNDIINIELENTTETGVANILKFRQNSICRLRQNRLISHQNYRNDTTQEIDISYHRDTEKYENTEYYPEEIYSEYLETKMRNLEINPENIAPGFGDPVKKFENEKNNFGFRDPIINFESLKNKSEFTEKTEQDLQGNDELELFKYSYDSEHLNDHTEIWEADEENALRNGNENFRVEILENIIIKHAKSERNNEMVQTRKEVLIESSNNDTYLGEREIIDGHGIEFVNCGNFNNENEMQDVGNSIFYQHINDKMLKAVGSQQDNNIATVEEVLKHAPETIASPSTQNSTNETKDNETIHSTNESENKIVKTTPKFDNFKVPREVTNSKRKIVKKPQSRFVLTHVVGGYIIQESNFAFPVSKKCILIS